MEIASAVATGDAPRPLRGANGSRAIAHGGRLDSGDGPDDDADDPGAADRQPDDALGLPQRWRHRLRASLRAGAPTHRPYLRVIAPGRVPL
jgi:hypothetical protein